MPVLSGTQNYSMMQSSLSMIQRVLSSSGVNVPGGVSSTFSNDLLGSSLSRVTISTFGSQINQIYNKLKSIEDDGTRENALSGMRDIFTKLVTQSDSGTLFSFISSASRAADTDLSAFQAIFSTGADNESPAPAASESASAGTTWTDMYGTLGGSEYADDFATAGLAVITGDGSSVERQTTYDALLAKAYDIMQAELPDGINREVADVFYGGLAEQQSTAERLNYIRDFDIAATATELNEETEDEASAETPAA